MLLPKGFDIPSPHLELPVFLQPKWEPVPIKRKDVPALKKKDEQKRSKPEAASDLPKPKTPEIALPSFNEVRSFTIPVIDQEVPVPPAEILVTAVSTATVASAASVAATLGARSLFEQVLKLSKPVTKNILKKLAKVRHRPPPLTWGRARLLERRHRR